WHMIGLELGISIASVGLRREATGAPIVFNADVVATAQRNLSQGEGLDGEGGYTLFGKLAPARASLSSGPPPLGLAHNVRLRRPIAKDTVLQWTDVVIDEQDQAVQARRQMERPFAR